MVVNLAAEKTSGKVLAIEIINDVFPEPLQGAATEITLMDRFYPICFLRRREIQLQVARASSELVELQSLKCKVTGSTSARSGSATYALTPMAIVKSMARSRPRRSTDSEPNLQVSQQRHMTDD